jgi:hypothetical protein
MRDNRTGEYYCYAHRERIYSRPYEAEAPRPKVESKSELTMGMFLQIAALSAVPVGMGALALVGPDVKKLLLIMLSFVGACVGLGLRVWWTTKRRVTGGKPSELNRNGE